MSFSPVAPPDDIAKGLAEKKKIIDSLREPAPKPEPMRPSAPSPKDRVGKGSYGSGPGEKRIDVRDMTKPLGTFHKGTNYVPKTGNYTLEKGEAVVPKEKNMVAGMYAKVLEGDKKPKKEIKSIRTHKSHDGKYIHTHEHHHPMHHPDETHVSNNMDEMKAHMEANEPNMTAAPSETGAEAQDAAVGA